MTRLSLWRDRHLDNEIGACTTLRVGGCVSRVSDAMSHFSRRGRRALKKIQTVQKTFRVVSLCGVLSLFSIAVLMTSPAWADISGSEPLAIDDEYLPLQKFPPVYPRAAMKRGIVGWCIVSYTVTAQGKTRDLYPESCSPAGLFEAASITAAKKFIYKPRIVDGVAVEVVDVQNKFSFELEKTYGKPLDTSGGIHRFTDVKENRLRIINRRIEKDDWPGLKKFALSTWESNYRMLYFAGYADLMMGNTAEGYALIEQYIFHEDKNPPFEFVTFNALKLLVTHYYTDKQYEALIGLDDHTDIWLYRLIEPEETNRMALMIADAFLKTGNRISARKRLTQIVDRAASPDSDPFVTSSRKALGL